MKVSIIVPCKGRLHQLKKTLHRLLWQTWDKGNKEIIVVDYNCPQGTHEWANFITGIRAVKADVGENEWNLSAARNVGAEVATGEVFLFVDADFLLSTKFVEGLIIKKGEFLTGNMGVPSYNCCGLLMVMREDFIKVGGYNEALINGWGYEDFDMRGRLEAAGLVRRECDPNLIREIQHNKSNSTRNFYHGRKEIDESNNENRLLSERGIFLSRITKVP